MRPTSIPTYDTGTRRKLLEDGLKDISFGSFDSSHDDATSKALGSIFSLGSHIDDVGLPSRSTALLIVE